MVVLNRKERYMMMERKKSTYKQLLSRRCCRNRSVNKEKINTSTVLALLQTRAEYKPRFKNKECLQILPTSKNTLGKLKELPEKTNFL